MKERRCQQDTDVDCRGSLSVVLLQKGPGTPKTMGWIFRNSEDPEKCSERRVVEVFLWKSEFDSLPIG